LTNKQNVTGNNTAKPSLSLTMAEVSLHNASTDCWQVINGNVYDLSQYIASGKHPNNKISDGCGKDATAIFSAIAKHNSKAQAMLPQYLLGALQN
jgi:cytochrome b involved in lipid metabolism